ncbi:MAG TPA: helix-turn-helix transcriptional regulator [Solirubrobacteraceae bacterium]|nr:helix-turn-helix transcriptional regulator [Solirubrobacteraceae bacterium]
MSAPTPRKTKMLDTSRHDRYLAKRLADDPEFRAEYERQRRSIAAIDEIVNRLDSLRVEHDYTKAELARAIDKNPASVRRLLTARGNPELATVVAMADALDADVLVVPRKSSRRPAAPSAA